jgi:hypothetical protein
VADMDEMVKKAQAEGTVVSRNLVIVAKSEREMKEIMKNL